MLVIRYKYETYLLMHDFSKSYSKTLGTSTALSNSSASNLFWDAL